MTINLNAFKEATRDLIADADRCPTCRRRSPDRELDGIKITLADTLTSYWEADRMNLAMSEYILDAQQEIAHLRTENERLRNQKETDK